MAKLCLNCHALLNRLVKQGQEFQSLHRKIINQVKSINEKEQRITRLRDVCAALLPYVESEWKGTKCCLICKCPWDAHGPDCVIGKARFLLLPTQERWEILSEQEALTEAQT